MFQALRRCFRHLKPPRPLLLRSPIRGTAVRIAEVSDPAFSGEWLGKGLAIRPIGRRVVAPFDGFVKHIFGHAVGLVSADGVEILIHVGLDTIQLKGRHSTVLAQAGDSVKAGDALLEFDLDAIVAEGFDPISPLVVCNSERFSAIDVLAEREVRELEPILRLTE